MRPSLLPVLALAGLALLGPSAAADTLVWAGNKKPRPGVKVLRENTKEVVFLPSGQGAKEQTVKAAEVRTILYEDAPEAFRVADQERGQKRWAAAAKGYEKAMRAAGVRDWIKVYGNFYLGECYRRLGSVADANYDTAIQHYKATLAQQPDCRILAEVLYGLAQAHRGKKDYASAETRLGELSKAVSDHGLDPSWDFRAQLEAARLLESQDRFGEAGAKYRALKGRAGVPADIANLATMREGLCLVYGNKFDEARSHFQGLVKSAGVEEWDVRAGAHLGLGLCFYREEKFVEARYEFLRVNAVYGNTEAHAEATFWAAKANLRLTEKEKGVTEMAKLQFTQVMLLHGDSPFADKAEEEMIKLGVSREDLARIRKK
jgi:outer membrane protein assembly factor BamD (BamD/ComL family)